MEEMPQPKYMAIDCKMHGLMDLEGLILTFLLLDREKPLDAQKPVEMRPLLIATESIRKIRDGLSGFLALADARGNPGTGTSLPQ